MSGTGDAAGAILYSVDGNDTAAKGLWSLATRDCDSRQSSWTLETCVQETSTLGHVGVAQR